MHKIPERNHRRRDARREPPTEPPRLPSASTILADAIEHLFSEHEREREAERDRIERAATTPAPAPSSCRASQRPTGRCENFDDSASSMTLGDFAAYADWCRDRITEPS